MAIIQAAMLVADAAVEAASLVWMELAMFGVAALMYVLFAGGVPPRGASKAKTPKDGSEGKGNGHHPSDAERRKIAAQEDHRALMAAWEQVKSIQEAPQLDLVKVVDAMQKVGRSTADVAAELGSALDANPALLAGVAALPAALLRDDWVEMVDVILCLLEERGHVADIAAHAGLMAAQLRRRNYVGVAKTAARLPSEALTPRMRAIAIAAAAHRGCLDDALNHLQQMSEPAEDAKSPIAPSLALQILSLAARAQRMTETTRELQRMRARLDARSFDDLLTAESRRLKCLTSCRELLEAGAALEVPKGPNAYHAMARALGQAVDSEGLQALLQELEVEAKKGPTGIAVSEPLALALLEASRAVRDGNLAFHVLDLHRLACAGAPGGKVLSAVCGTLAACDLSDAACDFYEKELVTRGVLPDMALMTALMQAATKTGRTGLAQRLSDHAGAAKSGSAVGSAGSAGRSSEIQRHVAMIKAHARERDLKSAAAVFDRLQASGVSLTPVIYNCFLDACVQCGDVERAVAHFDDMKRLNCVDVVGCNTLLKAYLSRGCTDRARDLVKDMKVWGLQANKVTYNELLHAKVMAKDRRGVWEHVSEMQSVGIRPNSVTCSILLKLLAANSTPAEVRRVIELIEQIEEPIDEVLFSSVIEACVRIKQLDLLSNLMRRYRQKGGFVSLAAPTYGSMIKAYGQAGDVVRVNELWQEMEEYGVKPTSITLGCMVEALVTNGEAQQAWDLVHKQLENEERRGCINTVIYSTVLKGFAVTRQIEKVFVAYEEMRAKDIPCNTITYNTLLDACAKCNAMKRASKLLEDMAASCVEPDIITYSTIVKGYCVEGDVDRAFKVLEDMQSDDKFSPDEIMYNSILDGCAKQHRVDDALRVLDEMKIAGIAPSNYTLSILVKVLGHARRLGQAFRMVEDLSKQNGFRPNVQVYTCLVQACVLNKKLERALSLHDTMVADVGSAIDEKFYAVLAKGCLQLHQPLKAIEIVRAAYQLPGHGLAASAKKNGAPVGVEARTLEELAGRLQAGSKEEQEALVRLNSDLLELRGFRIAEAQAGGQGARRRGGGGGGGAGGHSAGRGGGAGRGAGRGGNAGR